MANLADFRKQHPDYDGVSDKDLTDALYNKYYSHLPRAQFDNMMNVPGTTVGQPANSVPLPEGSAVPISVPQTTSQGLGFMEGAKIPLDNAAVAVSKWLRAGGIPVDKLNSFFHSPDASQIRDQDIQYLSDQHSKGVTPGTAGNIAGSMVADVPAMLATRRPWLTGGVTGALHSEAPDAKGVLRDAAIGAVAGKAGDVAVRGTGALVAPQVRPAVNELLSRGVKLTPGQIVGGTVHRLEDASTSLMLPFVTDAQNRSLHSFNKAVVNEALAPLNMKLPESVEAGHASVAYAQRAFDDAYSGIKSKLSLKKDAQFDADSGNLHNLVMHMPPDYVKMFNKHLSDVHKEFAVPGQMSGQPMYGLSSTVSGQTFKDMEETLGKEAQRYSGNGATPTDRKYSDAIKELQAQLRDLAGRQNPKYASQLQAINNGYAFLTRAEKAAANTKDGVFTPGQFRSAVVGSDMTVRKNASAAGQAIGQDLATAGEKVLPRTIGDSGTAARGLLIGALGLGGAGYVPHVNPLAAGAAGAVLSAYTKRGGDIASAVLTRRPAGALAARRVLQRSAPVVADVAAGVAVRKNDRAQRGEVK